eukprot:CAMPEP_0170573382 /NCGR_PEP_ID=MMETSP0224-20130122/2736_1 /TAXON_ID=285029 /ORGANISM="Togula jolla, Strain CCCM 725" /LENGTH=971 /DNA_ID=CAMNT_0010895967 /DNA_START=21 /DNA_END=2936 /DNA_ORIENTATION=-
MVSADSDTVSRARITGGSWPKSHTQSTEVGDGSDVKPQRSNVSIDTDVTKDVQVSRDTGRLLALNQRKTTDKYATVSRKIVEHKLAMALTTVLTIYALLGDDFRLYATNMPADPIFNVMVIICVIIFSIEVLLSCLGKSDYYMGFFFFLDVVSTVSLVLDLTFVADTLYEGDGEDDGGETSTFRSGRTAKIGARSGRVVRVLRLVRILKLYKAILEGRRAHQKKREFTSDDEWDDDEKEEEEQHMGGESRVGKKLSELTTRQVIFLILSSLLVIPILQPSQADSLPFSTDYGVNSVSLAFQGLQQNITKREAYEAAFLRMVWYHNWFADRGFCEEGRLCPDQHYGRIFWAGIIGEDSEEVSQISKAAVEAFQTTAERQLKENHFYNFGTMPARAREILSSAWTANCNTRNNNELRVRQGLSLLEDPIEDVVGYAVQCPDGLRPQELKLFKPVIWSQLLPGGSTIAPGLTSESQIVFYADVRPYVREDALFNALITCFVCFLLLIASLQFSHDANRLVLKPVENMIRTIESIRANPLIATEMADEEFRAEERKKARKSRQQAKEHMLGLAKDIITFKACNAATSNLPMETVILEKTIIKLGCLLALGFGEAGANIVSQNMMGRDSASVNAMIPGQVVECIIGVARVRDFGIATEVLNAKIMTFVNQIAEIVHGVVTEHYGAPNKNFGEVFLVIWRTEVAMDSMKARLADLSVIAFTKILAAIHRSPLLADYRGHPGLQLRLGSSCRVHMSFGLHSGWAIEGAVGSEYKIDASYLSPNVSIATSVEQATMSYGVPLIVAQSVVDVCSASIVSKCRLIDRVIISGSQYPMELHSIDLDYMSLGVFKGERLRIKWSSRQRFRARQFLEIEKAQKWDKDTNVVGHLECDPDFIIMRRRYTVDFMQLFNMGYQNYSQGEWEVAKRMLSRTQTMLGHEDGPSVALLRFMESSNFVAPKKWANMRDLHPARPGWASHKT